MAFRLHACTEAGARFLKDSMPSAEARREARTLMRHILRIDEHEYFKDPQRRLNRSQFSRFADLIRRRAAGEPFAYLVGRREFFSIEFQVNPSVLIPRPETEDLIELVLKEHSRPPARMIDIGTGSACIAAVLALQWKDSEVIAVDISTDALETARHNLMELSLENRITLIHSDLLDNVKGMFELIVSNPPYILKEEFDALDRDVRQFEPGMALVVENPEPFFSRFFQQAFAHLLDGGRLYLESSPALLPMQCDLTARAGFSNIRIEKDLSGKDRFLVACKKSVQR